jgi:hypothetical protein
MSKARGMNGMNYSEIQYYTVLYVKTEMATAFYSFGATRSA